MVGAQRCPVAVGQIGRWAPSTNCHRTVVNVLSPVRVVEMPTVRFGSIRLWINDVRVIGPLSALINPGSESADLLCHKPHISFRRHQAIFVVPGYELNEQAFFALT